MIKMTKADMIRFLIRQDIDDIRQAMYADDYEFLERVLSGEGWKPYNQLSADYIRQEYKSRLSD